MSNEVNGLTETYNPSNAQKFPQTKTVSKCTVFLFFFCTSKSNGERKTLYL